MAEGMTGSNSAMEALVMALLTNHNNGFGNCESQTELARQIAEVSSSMIQATQAQNLAAIQATNAVGQAAQEVAQETRADINRVEGSIQLAQAQSEARLTTGTSAVGARVEANGGDTRTSVERTAAETRRDISDAQATLHQTLEDRTTEIRLIAAENFATTLLEIERSKFATTEARCELARQAAENLGAIQLEASRNAAAIQLEAAKTKFDLATKMEECCCEVKETVRSEGDRTRSLIEKNEIDRLREALEFERRANAQHQHAESIRLSVQQYMNSPVARAA